MQWLNRMAVMNATFNIWAKAGWPPWREHQLFDDLKCKYNPNDKSSRVQMIKKLNKIKPKMEEDPKVMCNSITTLVVYNPKLGKVKQWPCPPSNSLESGSVQKKWL